MGRMKLTGDIEKDLDLLKVELEQRGLDGMRASICVETIPETSKYRRNAMNFLLPLMMCCVNMGRESGIDEDEIKSEKFMDTLEMFASVALLLLTVDCVHEDELDKIKEGINGSN